MYSLSKVSRIRVQEFEGKLDWLREMGVPTMTQEQKIQLKLHKNESGDVLEGTHVL